MTRAIIHLVAAARPNFMKIAPLHHALRSQDWCEARVIHTGQHYDANMSGAFFSELGLPAPDHNLNVGSGSHAEQTAGVMVAYERLLEHDRPDWIVVVGDVNSTAACAIVGVKACIPVVHLEAGLRSGDRRMPEEINRLVTDAISDVLWTPSPDADENLEREGIPAARIDRVGNIMIDSLEMMRPTIEACQLAEQLGLHNAGFGVVTLHRPSNVDERSSLTTLVDELVAVSHKLPLVFAVHPRTRKRLEQFGLLDTLRRGRITTTEPLSYVQFMSLVMSARAIITDSGGVQEESTYLGVPCLTLRENTERPITITHGTNRLVKAEALASSVTELLDGRWNSGRRPELWDGHTAERCVAALRRRSAS